MKHWEQKKFKDGKALTIYFEPHSVWYRQGLKLVAEPDKTEVMVDTGERCGWVEKEQLLATFKEAIKWIEGLK